MGSQIIIIDKLKLLPPWKMKPSEEKITMWKTSPINLKCSKQIKKKDLPWVLSLTKKSLSTRLQLSKVCSMRSSKRSETLIILLTTIWFRVLTSSETERWCSSQGRALDRVEVSFSSLLTTNSLSRLWVLPTRRSWLQSWETTLHIWPKTVNLWWPGSMACSASTDHFSSQSTWSSCRTPAYWETRTTKCSASTSKAARSKERPS